MCVVLCLPFCFLCLRVFVLSLRSVFFSLLADLSVHARARLLWPTSRLSTICVFILLACKLCFFCDLFYFLCLPVCLCMTAFVCYGRHPVSLRSVFVSCLRAGRFFCDLYFSPVSLRSVFLFCLRAHRVFLRSVFFLCLPVSFLCLRVVAPWLALASVDLFCMEGSKVPAKEVATAVANS